MQVARSNRSQSEVVGAFRAELSQLEPSNIHVLPDLSGLIPHDGTPNFGNLHLSLGLHVSPDQIEAAGRAAVPTTPESISFHQKVLYRVGRENSRNNVIFGGLSAEWVDGAGYKTDVAVKPAEVHPHLLGELAMLQYMQSLGIRSLEPEGYLVGETASDSRDYLITRFNGPIDTMDNIDWDELDSDEQWGQAGLAIETLALLHSNLLFHGDLEFKNIGLGETGEAVVVDPEYMVSALDLADAVKENPGTSQSEAKLIRLRQLMSRDFGKACSSIGSCILNSLPPESRPRNDSARLKLLNRRIYKPYKAALLDRGSSHLGVLLSAYDMMTRDNRVRANENSL
jgi:hypothetical protein